MAGRKATWAEREARFWSNFDKDGPIPEHRPDLGPCWVWKLRKNNKGYGLVTWHGIGTKSVARVAYEFANGPLPSDLEPDHLCRNRPCGNPAHLEAVSHRVNVQRTEQAQRTHCPRGHEYTAENTYRSPSKPNKRVCRTCRRERSAEWREANREQFNARSREYRRARKEAA
jgi:hypothetical protein